MPTIIKSIALLLICSALLGCFMHNPEQQKDYYNSSNFTYNPLYPEGYETGGNFNPPQPSSPASTVVVPESYHVGIDHSPVPPKDVDKNWVATQSPEHFTIELVDADKPYEVAKILSEVPKNERTAELKYERNGKTYYKGMYGTFDSYEAAQAALNQLPEAVKQTAGIKRWDGIQQNS